MVGSKDDINSSAAVSSRQSVSEKPLGVPAYITNYAHDNEGYYLVDLNLGVSPMRVVEPFFIERSIDEAVVAGDKELDFSSGDILAGKVS